MYYIKYMPYKSIKNASRNRRELSAAAELGFDTLVFSSDEQGMADGETCKVVNDGTNNNIRGTGALGKIAWIINNRLTVYKRTHALPSGIWSCHDLHSLKIAFFSSLFFKDRPLLVYDSHEFELGRNKQRNQIQKAIVRAEEGFLIRKSLFTIVVNDSIADELQKIYKLKQRPIAVRSTPGYWKLDANEIITIRQSFLQEFKNKGESVEFIIMYHGILTNGRGIEEMLEAQAQLPDVGSVILGNGESRYVSSIQDMAERLGIKDRVLFHPAVPPEQLKPFVAAADAGMVIIPPVVKSYYFALPNKYFENIQAETPVIVSDLPEIVRLTEKYNIGIKCDINDVDSISDSIRRMMTETDFYDSLKRNIKKAKEDLCWENEKKTLTDAISRYCLQK